METIYKPERQPNESFSEYKNRRIKMSEKLKSHKRGQLVWSATTKGTFVGNVMRDLR